MIILQGISVDEFFQKLEVIIQKNIQELLPKPEPKVQYLTRKEVSKLLRITLPTLHDWTKLGRIQAYRIGNRILYKSNEIDQSILKLKYR